MVFRVLLLLLIAFPAHAAEVAGIRIEEKAQVENSSLSLNGAGLRKRAFFQVYAMGLYLPEKKTAAAEAIGAAGPKRVAIHMLRDVGADQFSEALMDGMRDNHSEADMKALEPRARQLAAIMAEMKEARKGMRITLDWLPGKGTQLTVEGKPSGAPIAGEDFYRALLRIWLGENAVQADLKKALLGGS
ncbi:MAG: chalcone isomerase family protein [Betaproteobacteria bacterium]|nr:chalcone isomerase family protein [Betaproteobacteria bacterium]